MSEKGIKLIITEKGKIIWASKNFCKLVKFQRGEVLKKYLNINRDILKGELVTTQGRLKVKVAKHDVELNKEKLVLYILEDVEECQDYDLLRKFELVVNCSRELITMISKDYKYLLANKAYCEAHGKAPKDILGKTVAEIWGKENFEKYIKPKLNLCLKGKEVIYKSWMEFEKLGRVFMDVRFYPFRDRCGRVTNIVAVSRDATQMKIVKDNAIKMANQNRAIARLSQIGLAGTEIDLLKDMAIMAIAEGTNAIFCGIISKDQDKKTWQISSHYGEHFFKDGIPLEVILQKTRKVSDFIYKLNKKDIFDLQLNLSEKVEYLIVSEIFSIQQKLEGYIIAIYENKPLSLLDYNFINSVSNVLASAILRANTERALFEKQEELKHTQKLEAIGRVVSEIAHDFNNIVTGIAGYAQLLGMNIKEIKESQKIMEYIQEIQKATEIGSGLAKKLLEFSRKKKVRFEVINLNRLIKDYSEFFKMMAGEHELILNLYKNLKSVQADREQIYQVILNLIVNAKEAMTTKGKIELSTYNVEFDYLSYKKFKQARYGEYVCISVADSGCGIKEELLEKIFEPFFTTKTKGKTRGTGLGLSMVYNIVKLHKGWINVETELNKGTTFKVFIPIYKK